ncbi:MAG TPA: sigma-54 dependent transcriptional regulator [Candidatus Eisenbacteria bacterium]|nr:sigma-54 dependent transcriptional regulator [Candidatus Eisenbacteria bacterium]
MLVVDDDPGSSGLLRDIFQQEGYDVTLAERGEEALALAPARPFDVVLCDVQLPDCDGIELLARLKRVAPTTAVIMVTAFGTYETAIKALHMGAFDYVRKPFTLQEVRLTVERAMERRRLQKSAAANAPAAGGEARPIIGRNQAMVELFKLVSRVAATKSSVLIQGESGTGKELIARTIHQGSPRASGPFVAVNVTSLSETLLESELFGHVKGAFTGAIERRPGLFVEANRGTIFLDEVGDMSLPMQAKLLRVLQEHELKPVGGNETIPVDVRMVAATHQDLEELVHKGRFREDLYYRLNVVTLRVPRLHERPEDIPLLAEHFLKRFGALSNRPLLGFSSAAMAALSAYPWPGNVRELENVVDRAVALAPGSVVELTDLPDKLIVHAHTGPRGRRVPDGLELRRLTLDQTIREYVLLVLDEVGGNKTEAARVLDVPRRTLYRMLDRYGVLRSRSRKARRNASDVTD